jgi:hypothetical protein
VGDTIPGYAEGFATRSAVLCRLSIFVVVFGDACSSGLSQSNHYYKSDVCFVCPLLLNRFSYPSNSVPI